MPLSTCSIPLAIYHLQCITLRLTTYDLPIYHLRLTNLPLSFLRLATCDFPLTTCTTPPLPPTLYTWPRRSRTYPVCPLCWCVDTEPVAIMDDEFWKSLDLIQKDVRNLFELNQVSKHKRALQCFWYFVYEMECDITWSYQCWRHKLFIRLFLRV